MRHLLPVELRWNPAPRGCRPTEQKSAWPQLPGLSSLSPKAGIDVQYADETSEQKAGTGFGLCKLKFTFSDVGEGSAQSLHRNRSPS